LASEHTVSSLSQRATHRAHGFTLIELLIVIVIIGILAAIAIPKFNTTKQRANKSAGVADLRNLATAQEAFYADSDRYGGISDTALMRFSLSRGNTGLGIVLTGAPLGTTGWNAVLSVPGAARCGIYVGAATPPTGMPTGTPDGVPACW
jgi:type IV pilus assembly protein PilA